MAKLTEATVPVEAPGPSETAATMIPVATATVPFTAQLLAEVIEVFGFIVVPGENLVGIVLRDDFLLNEGVKPGFNSVFVDRGHHSVGKTAAS